jgi:hypothetical protein
MLLEVLLLQEQAFRPDDLAFPGHGSIRDACVRDVGRDARPAGLRGLPRAEGGRGVISAR